MRVLLHFVHLLGSEMLVWAIARSPGGGVGELRKARRNHFHLSRYLIDSMVPNYSPNTSRCRYVVASTVASSPLKGYIRSMEKSLQVIFGPDFGLVLIGF
jgi:hypothetical protein